LAAAATGHVLTLDPSLSSQHHPDNERRTLSRETARVVIAQRAGVENYHVGKSLSDDEIEAINDYGLQTHMLSASKEDARTFILAFVDEDEAEGEMGLLPNEHAHVLTRLQLSPKKHRLSPLIPLPQYRKRGASSMTSQLRPATVFTAGLKLRSNLLPATPSTSSPATTHLS
jgi:hypothetical protein